MRITRFPSITGQQFFGCNSAFVDTLGGELNAAAAALRRLENRNKGGAFAYEMTLDQHRYGALIVIDRWVTVLRAFGPHLDLPLLENAIARTESAEEILKRANHVIDSSERYTSDMVEACVMAFQAVQSTFGAERSAAEQSAKLGPMQSDEYKEARQIFLEDLAAR